MTTQNTTTPTKRCSACGHTYPINREGLITRHYRLGEKYQTCLGSRKAPAKG